MTDEWSSEPGPSPLVTHRRYVSFSDAHYAGSLVSGAFVLGLFGDMATELCIRSDGEEGLFASYSDVQFIASVRAGDLVEVSGRLTGRGKRSRQVELECRVVARLSETEGSRSEFIDPSLLAVTASGTLVVGRASPR